MPGISEPPLHPHSRVPSVPVQHYTESTVASTSREITGRSSYFKTVNKRVCKNQEDKLADEQDYETDSRTLSGAQLRNSGMLKRRKLSGLQTFEDVSDCLPFF